MRHLLAIAALLLTWSVLAAEGEWVEVGADTEGTYYINPKSIQVDGDTIRLQKRQVFNAPLVDNFSGHRVLFKETIGTVELDCRRHINRVTRIDMILKDSSKNASGSPVMLSDPSNETSSRIAEPLDAASRS